MNQLKIIAEPRYPWLYNYLLYGLYSLTLAPIITRFINYGQINYYVAVCGFVFYIAEFFAFKIKLNIIQIRAEIERQEHKEKTGEILPRQKIAQVLWFPLCTRILFRLAFIMISFTALGIKVDADSGRDTSGIGILIIIGTIFIEVLSLYYLTSQSPLFDDPPNSKEEAKEENIEYQQWDKQNLTDDSIQEAVKEEPISDIVLSIYSFMIFTACWEFLNQFGIKSVHESIFNNETAFFAGLDLFMMLGMMVIVGLAPLRLSYWMESSLLSITPSQKWMVVGNFFIAALMTCAPAIREYINVYFPIR